MYIVPGNSNQKSEMQDLLGGQLFSCQDLICGFLHRRGKPSPTLFDALASTFDSQVDSSDEALAEPGYRARMLVWSATGLPLLQRGGNPIEVSLLHLS